MPHWYSMNWDAVVSEGLECSVAFDAILEIAIPFAALSAEPGDSLQFAVKLTLPEGELIERWPPVGLISLVVPSGDYENKNWSV